MRDISRSMSIPLLKISQHDSRVANSTKGIHSLLDADDHTFQIDGREYS